jgi:dienelactone hydrolase
MVIDALTTFKTPYSMAIGDKDMVFKEKDVLSTQAKVREKVGTEEDNNYEIKIYKGCMHGFAVRAAPGNKVESDAAEEAAKQAIEWYKKYLN